MKYTLTVPGMANQVFDSEASALSAGQLSGCTAFAVITTVDGLPKIHATAVLVTYKQQNGRKGKMWNIAFC